MTILNTNSNTIEKTSHYAHVGVAWDDVSHVIESSGYPVILDGDQWEVWGEKVLDGNPGPDAGVDAAHVIIPTDDPEAIVDALKRDLGKWLVPMERDYQRGVLITVTSVEDWSVHVRTLTV